MTTRTMNWQGTSSLRETVSTVRRAWATWRQAVSEERTRRSLVDLDPRLLRDIGLTQGDVFRETGRPFRFY